jgi:predicted  nucleic acid-binding Zn-ribbon protein
MIKADRQTQQLLLKLQEIDNKILQVEHRNATLPARKQLEANKEKLFRLKSGIEKIENEIATDDELTARELVRAENLRARLKRVIKRQESGEASANELEALAQEKDLIGRQISEIENSTGKKVLENKRRELQKLKDGITDLITVSKQISEQAKGDLVKLRDEHNKLMLDRNKLEKEIDPNIYKYYEIGRNNNASGLGVAVLKGDIIEGLNITLSQQEKDLINNSPEDVIFQLEEYEILVVRDFQ